MAALYEAIDESAIASGYQTVVAGTADVYEEQIKRADMMLARGVDGLLIADAHPDERYVAWVEAIGVPFLLVIRQAGNRVAVTGDDYLGGTLAGTHIADLGHERVAILAGLEWSSANIDRAQGCVDALRARGIAIADDMVQTCALDPHSGRAAMERLLDRDRAIDAVFAVDDFTAIGASLALREHGLRVGSEVALVGYNDVQIAAAFDLTTVRVPLRSIGSIAARLLLDVMANRKVESVRLAPELIVRGSSHRTVKRRNSRPQL
jgi:LacI family transcriptional regulator